MNGLNDLARMYGVQTEYIDAAGLRQTATEAGLLRVLQILGATSLQTVADVPRVIEERTVSLWKRPLEPVCVAWDGKPRTVPFRVPADATGTVTCTIQFEAEPSRTWTCELVSLSVMKKQAIGDAKYCMRRLPLPGPLSLGYHRLLVEYGGTTSECLLICAPIRAFGPYGRAQKKVWGVFAPPYGLHSAGSWGAGNFSDLERLLTWVHGLGGDVVATLPFLPAFLDEPYDPSPYSPASRLFWNEFYIDVERAPELQSAPAAQAIINSPEFQAEVAALRQEPLVDYRREMALKRKVLKELARVVPNLPERQAAFHAFVESRPQLRDYAQFRAVCDRRRTSWWNWPEPLRGGQLSPADYDPDTEHYHLYVQWLADSQLAALAESAAGTGAGLYLDLPLGVNSDSYDVWRERKAFAMGISVGAPPDPFFPKGQSWGFPPLHPEAIREQGYKYVRDYLSHHLRLAGTLRIDHMMGLSRLFWIPHGMEASQGVYVEYRAEELFAVFCLESQRNQAVLVGEDLGTVPPEIPKAMARHNIHRMYVLQFAANPDEPLPEVPRGSAASLNTHDMPTFASFWQMVDVQDRLELNILDEAGAVQSTAVRNALKAAIVAGLRERGLLKDGDDLREVLKSCLAHLCSGPAPTVIVNLEDLWLETNPQNVPGTWQERPNWRRKLRLRLEELMQDPQVLETLKSINATL